MSGHAGGDRVTKRTQEEVGSASARDITREAAARGHAQQGNANKSRLIPPWSRCSMYPARVETRERAVESVTRYARAREVTRGASSENTHGRALLASSRPSGGAPSAGWTRFRRSGTGRTKCALKCKIAGADGGVIERAWEVAQEATIAGRHARLGTESRPHLTSPQSRH